MEKKLTKIPAFNDHSNCQGHANWMLDCTYEKQADRDVMIGILDNLIQENEKKLD